MKNLLQIIISYCFLNITAIIGKKNYNYYKNNSKKAEKISEKKLLKVIQKNKNTSIGKKYDFVNIKTIQDFQKKIPYTSYDDYKEYIETTANTGEQNLITTDKINYFVVTSGTTGGYKIIPVVKSTFSTFLKNGTIFIYNLKKEMKKRKKGLLCGKVLNLSELNTITTAPSGIKVGIITGYFTSRFKGILSILTCIPKEVIGFEKDINMRYINARFGLEEENVICINSVFLSTLIDLLKYIEDNKEMLLKDIENGTIDKSIKIPEHIRKKLEKRLKPNKKRAEELEKIFRESSDYNGIIPKIWKRMSLINSVGTGDFAPYKKKLEKYCSGDIPFNYSMYAASEATIAIALEIENQNYFLIFNGGFYEFLEIDGKNKPLLLNELEVGKEYEIIVTNFTGLYRYKLQDVVKVVGYEGKVPIIQYAYRKNQLVNLTVFHLTTKQFADIIKKYAEALHINIVDYSLYVDIDSSPVKMIVFIETENEINIKEDISQVFDDEVTVMFPGFDEVIKKGTVSKSQVVVVKPGTYELLRESKIKNGISVNQIKTVKIIKEKDTLEYLLNSKIDFNQ